MGFLIFMLLVCVFGWCMVAMQRQDKRQREYYDVETLLNRAQGLLLFGKHDEAAIVLTSALAKAKQCRNPLREAEAIFMMAQVKSNNGDYKTAAKLLEQAVAEDAQWAGYKPAFASLIRREAAKARSQI